MLSTDPILEHTLRGHRGPITSLVFNPSSSQLASGGADNTVLVWNFKLNMRTFRFLGHTVSYPFIYIYLQYLLSV